MASISNNLSQMGQLEGLVLDHNPQIDIEELSIQIEKLTDLKVLLLRKNKLKKIPEDLSFFKNFAVLELSGNQFSMTEQERIKSKLPETNVIF